MSENKNNLFFLNKNNKSINIDLIKNQLQKYFDKTTFISENDSYLYVYVSEKNEESNFLTSEIKIEAHDNYFYIDFTTNFGVQFMVNRFENLYENSLFLNMDSEVSFSSIDKDENEFKIRSICFCDSINIFSIFIEKSYSDTKKYINRLIEIS